jgi:hypothetical protein
MRAAVLIMTDAAVPKSPKPSAGAIKGRYSLRTLFLVSVAVALPLLLVANLRFGARPDDSLASPLYLLIGVAGVLVSATIGNALGRVPGMLVTAIAAGLSWILLVALLSQFSQMLTQQLPVHVIAVVLTIGGLVAAVRMHREPNDDTPHEHLARLLEVKSRLHQAQPTDPPDPNSSSQPAEKPARD